MSKKISQETFDEAVRENVEDFDQNEADALADTINQFLKQGVDLSNVDTTGGVGRELMLNLITKINSVAVKEFTLDDVELISQIAHLCSIECELYKRNQMLMKEKNGLNSLHLMLDHKQKSERLIITMTLLNDLSKSNEEIRDFFEPGGCDKLCCIIKDRQNDKDVLLQALSLARTVIKSENNKNSLMRGGAGPLLVDLLVSLASSCSPENKQDTMILLEACQLVRGLCVHDDIRKDMSCAYENGKFFIKQPNFVQTLSTLAGNFRVMPAVASAALHSAKNLITSEESVQVMAQCGAIELITDILGYSEASLSLTRAAVGLMRNVCADDIRKDKLVSDGTLDLLVNAMCKEVYASDSAFMEHALACLAAMSLRSPSNSERIVANGQSLEIIVRNMRRHAEAPSLQRQGCLTIRNIAARCPDLRQQLLDAGCEDVLRAAGRLSGVVDEAYAALRDLECAVTFVKITEDGQVAPAYEQFGSGVAQRLFNPIYDDDSSVIEQRVQEEARAPLQADRLRRDMLEDEMGPALESEGAGGCCGGGSSHDHGHAGHDHAHDHHH